jgi:hypothetical protein
VIDGLAVVGGLTVGGGLYSARRTRSSRRNRSDRRTRSSRKNRRSNKKSILILSIYNLYLEIKPEDAESIFKVFDEKYNHIQYNENYKKWK